MKIRETILDFILYAQHTEINTIVDKHEYQKLMNFITVYAVNEMRYKPKVIK